ncbi:hypothetical protein LSCM1_01971 [Leishmania martiniquensis]|uniref:Uncharacterized protein n=1 Tax=Leishmania martiniquensis TaxID=1580590 RepID=A0A836H5E6_9TRYP|nr:hypothetical protein LSCM1_01971 [Leishmania martiniquensis]
MRRGSGEGGEEEGPAPVALTSTTVEDSVSPFTSLDTSLANSLTGYSAYDDDSASFGSPTPFSPYTHYPQTDPLTRSPPRPAVGSPMLIHEDVPKSGVLDLEAQLERRRCEESATRSAQPSQSLSVFPFNSSFFSHTTESPTSAELPLTPKSPASASSFRSPAPSGSRAPLPRAGPSSLRSTLAAPASSSAVHEAVPPLGMSTTKTPFTSSLLSSGVLAGTQTTMSLLVPPSLEAPSAMTTPVLPLLVDREGLHCILASRPAIALSELPLRAPRAGDDLQGEERERGISASPAKDLSTANTVSTLPLAALSELPSSSFSASSSAASPLSPTALSLDETHICASLSHLATSLLDADSTPIMADEPDAQNHINAATLSWVPMPLPAMPAPKRRPQKRVGTGPPHGEGHGDTACCGQGNGNPVEVRRCARRKMRERASATDDTLLAAEVGALALAPLPRPRSSARRRRGFQAVTKDADQSSAATTASSDAELAPIPGTAATLDQEGQHDRLRGLAEPSRNRSPASHTEAGCLSFSPTAAKPPSELCPREMAALEVDMPLSSLLAAGGDLCASATPMVPASCQRQEAPVSSPSQGRKLRWRPQRKARPSQIATEGAEESPAPFAGQMTIETAREMAEAAPTAAASLPLPLALPAAPQVLTHSAELGDGGAGCESPASNDSSAAPKISAAVKGQTSTVPQKLPARRRPKNAPAAAPEVPPSTGKGGASDNNSAATQAVLTIRRAAALDPSPLQAWWCAMRASASSSKSGRPCLWIELTEGYQEAHGTLLRQVLVCWGCLLRESCASTCGGVELPIGGSPRPPISTWGCWSRKRTRDRKGGEAGGDGESAPVERVGKKCTNGLVVLLCPSSLPMARVLRWWAQRAHVEHSFMPPLLAVTMSADSPSAAVRIDDREPSAFRGAATPEEELELLKGAFAQASRMYCTDVACSLAVSCTAAGHAVLSQLLPAGQVFESLQICADLLGPAVGFPPASLLVETPLEGGTDVGSLTAVLAVTPPPRDISGSCSNAGEGWRAASLQERCFAELCRWNGLAATLQRQPRRPQLILCSAHADTLPCNGGASKGKGKATAATISLSALVDALEGVQYAPNVADSSLLPRQRQMRVMYGLVLPATRNEDTFASSARREARVLASQPPPVTLAPVHLSALYLFGRTLFTPDNYVTAVNVVESLARVSQRCLSDYLSDYSCATTGPLRYAVSATVRRYLQVRLLVALAPLLALINEGVATQQRSCTTLSASGARVSLSSPSTLRASVVLLARSEWRTIVPSLSCSCNPRFYEQVPRTDDGVKVCRHLAELFYYFITRQLSVVGRQVARREQPLQQCQPQRAPARDDPIPSLQSPLVSLRTRSLEKRQRPTRSNSSRSRSSSSAGVTSNSVPLSALYTNASRLCTDAERTVCKQGRDDDSESEDTASKPSALPSAPTHSLRHGAIAARPSSTRSDAPRTRSSKKAKRSSTVAAADASMTSPAGASAAGSDFHTQALQYALRLLHERLRDGSGEKPADGGAASLALGDTGDGEPLFRTGGSSPPASVRKRTHSGDGTPRETEHVRAIRLLEQMLRNQLR